MTDNIMQTIAVIALGCPKNTVEAEYLLGIFQEKGFKVSSNLDEADIVVIHTCSFIKAAKAESEKCIRTILDKLLVKLSKINGLKWIRLLYAYPSSITDGLIEVFKDHKKICSYMDIPIQHVSKNVLSAMKRPLSTPDIYY
ncbi:MAG: hypothetical protein LBN19_04795 [Endomicrobium sp.]|jgi:tRNA A37 methylthiotransferase MiaB|nr:hypothetical protein [Endomicrobium sp.]